jgi:hypothetical protein
MRIQANNQNNWAMIWQLPVAPSPYEYEDLVVCPIILSSHVIAIHMESNEAQSRNWRVAGYLNQLIAVALPETSQAVTSGGTKVFFNKVQIVTFPLVGEYMIELTIKAYLTQGGNFTIWEYIGGVDLLPVVLPEAQVKGMQDLTNALKALVNGP